VQTSAFVILLYFCAKFELTHFKCPAFANTQNVSGNGRTTTRTDTSTPDQTTTPTQKKIKKPTAQERKFFANAFGTFGFAPTHKANASQNQKSQANQSPPTIPKIKLSLTEKQNEPYNKANPKHFL